MCRKTCSETIITNNEKTVLVHSNIEDHQNNEKLMAKKNNSTVILTVMPLKMYMKSE